RHTRFDCDWSSDVCSSDLGSPAHPTCADGIPPKLPWRPRPLAISRAPPPLARSPVSALPPFGLLARGPPRAHRSSCVAAFCPARSEERRVGTGWSAAWLAG